MTLREAVLAVTYRCNCRCTMCNIWQLRDHREMPPAEYAKLPPTLRTINVTGGEPFLRKDLLDIVRNLDVAAPRSRLVFSSNGMMTDTIVDTMKLIRARHQRVGVGISIDGMESTHDEIRGIPGCYQRAMRTVEALKEEGFKDLRLGMTISERNTNQIEKVYHLARSLDVQFTATVAHNSQIYFHTTCNEPIEAYHDRIQGLQRVIDSHIQSWRVKDWFRAYHLQGLVDGSIRSMYEGHCTAGSRYVFVAPDGDVFPCSVLSMKLGNLTEVEEWSELADSRTRRDVASAVHNCRNECWMVCNTRSLIYLNPLKAIKWIMGRRLSIRKTSS